MTDPDGWGNILEQEPIFKATLYSDGFFCYVDKQEAMESYRESMRDDAEYDGDDANDDDFVPRFKVKRVKLFLGVQADKIPASVEVI